MGKSKPKTKDKVRVRITARQVVRYSKIIELTQEEWNEFKSRSPESHTRCGDLPLFNEDIDDADDIDQDDFDACVVDADGKPTGDRYTWV